MIFSEMRKIIPILLPFFLVACIDLGYHELQPLGAETLDEFPEELKGVYANREDTLTINDYYLISKSDSTFLALSDSLVLRKDQGWYFLNITENNMGYWTVICARRKGNKLQLMIPEIDEDDKEALEKYWPVEEHYNSLENLEAFIIAPKREDWKKLLKSKFYSKTTFRRISD